MDQMKVMYADKPSITKINKEFYKLKCWKMYLSKFITLSGNKEEHTTKARGSFLRPPNSTREKLRDNDGLFKYLIIFC